MSKKEKCSCKSIAYYSGLNRVEIKDIEYGIEDYIYCVSGIWTGDKSKWKCHRLKIYYDSRGDAFFRLCGHRIPLNECLKI